MKKINAVVFLVVFCLLTCSMISAQNRRIALENINTGEFFIKNVGLIEQNGQLQFQFSLANKSKQNSENIGVVLSAYDELSNLRAKHISRKFDVTSVGSKTYLMTNVFSGLKNASRYTVEFLNPNLTSSLEADAFTSCTDDAIRACGTGKVKSVDCRVGDNGTVSSCSYECKASVGFEEGGS